MSVEVKEILEEIKRYAENEYDGTDCDLTNKDCKIFYNYITNLQEEKDKFKSRCEEAIEFIKNFKYGMSYTDEGCTRVELLEENIELGGE